MKKILVLTALTFCLTGFLEARQRIYRSPRMHRSTSSQPEWDDRLDLQAIEDRLRTEEVAHTERISRYLEKNGKVSKASHYMLIVFLESGLKAVFKPGEYAYAEVAAYRANKALGQRLVPPTVFRTIEGKQGSLQFLVETPVDLRKTASVAELFKKVSAKDMSDMKLFYFVFGQWDAHIGNQLINPHRGKAHLALIDNAGILHRSYARYGDYFFIEKGTNEHVHSTCTTSFPFDQVKTIRPKSLNEVRTLFKPYISEEAIRKLWERHKPIAYCIWCDVLWMQMYKNSPTIKPPATSRYYASTLKAYENLHRTLLEKVWAEWLVENRSHGEQLIMLTLERRDQMLRIAYSSGQIINDIA